MRRRLPLTWASACAWVAALARVALLSAVAALGSALSVAAGAQLTRQPGEGLPMAQPDGFRGGLLGGEEPPGEGMATAGEEFVWLRGRYTSHTGRGSIGLWRRGGWWDTDYPDSDENFLRGVRRYTNVATHPGSHRNIDLTDPELFEHIFLYMNWKRVPVGTSGSGPDFSPAEVAALREFMQRGGFVLVDDFWGHPHLQDMYVEIGKIFPEREIVELDTSHEIFHIFFDIDELAQVPGRMVTWDYDGYMSLDDPGYPPRVFAVLDDRGRVMLVANYNTDLGDGWEHTFLAQYPTRYTNEAYKIGINFLIYAFSH